MRWLRFARRSKRPEIIQWEDALGVFRDGIVQLRAHIAKHQFVEGWEGQVAEMGQAVALIDRVVGQEHIYGDGGLWDSLEREESGGSEMREVLGEAPLTRESLDIVMRAMEDDWDALWAHLKEHMRKWWD